MQIEPNKTAILLVLIICSTTVPAVARNSEGFFSRVVAGLHEADVIKTKLLNDIQDVKQDIVMNSKVQHVDKHKDHPFSSSDVWHCLPPDSNFDIFSTSMKLFKTVTFNVTASNWDDGQGYIGFDVSKDRNALCALWNQYHPALPRLNMQSKRIDWIYLTERPISFKYGVESLLSLIPVLHPSFITRVSSFFGMCAECNKDDGGKCGYVPEQCNSYWLSARSKRCPSSGQAPMNVGNLRCISDDVQGEQGWCSVRIGPWHNVCVRVNSVQESSNDKEEPKYTMEMYTQYDLSYIQNFIVGASLVANSRFVASWRLAHYVIGFMFGVVAALVVMLRSVVTSAQKATMPSQVLSLASLTPILTFAFVGPLWNNLVMPALTQVLHLYFCTRRSCLVYDPRTSSEFYMSWFTKVVITVSGFIGMYLVSYFKIFKTIIAEDPELDEYGREHIVESRPASQILLCTVMEYAGYGILCHCTSNGVVSAFVIFLLYFRNFISYRLKLWTLWCYSRSPASFRELLNEQEYDELGEKYTNSHIEKLREYLQSPEGKKQMVRLKGYEMTERFVRGGNHIDDDEDENADGGSWWCNIM